MAETLVVSMQGIGNNLLALPLAKALARQDGQSVSLLARSPRAIPLLMRAEGIADVFASEDARFKGAAGRARLVSRIRKGAFRRCVFAFPSGARSHLLVYAAGIGERIGLRFPAIGRTARLFTRSEDATHGLHDFEHNVRLAALAGAVLDPEKDWPPLTPQMGRADFIAKFLEGAGYGAGTRFVGLHPGCDAGFAEKRWPERHFAALAEILHRELGLPAIVFDGPEEKGAGKRIARMAGSPVLALDGFGDLLDVLGLLSGCELFVANDSGLMNLAAAAGVPTVAVFGPSVTSRTRPFGPRSAYAATDRFCAPCYDMGRYAGCLFPERPCLADVSPERAAAAALEIVRR